MALTSQELQRALAKALNDIATVIVASSSSTSFTAAALVNATATADPGRLNARWAYPATGTSVGQQRRVRTSGNTPSTGATLIYPDWTAPPALSEIDLTSLFPRVAAASSASPGEDTDYRTICNRALERYPIPGQVTGTSVAGQYRYALTPTWIAGRDAFMRLLGPPLVANYPPQDDTWRVDRIDFEAGVPVLYLRAPYLGNGETFRLEGVRPASSIILGVESTNGLGQETDTVSPQVQMRDFLVIALDEAYKVLANRPHTGRVWPVEAQSKAAAEKIIELDARARQMAMGTPPQQMQGAA